MSKYLVNYRVDTYSGVPYEATTIYSVNGDMSEEDIIKFEDEMSKKKMNTVTMVSFNKLSDEAKKEAALSSNCFFFLYDTEYQENVLVYTPVCDLVIATYAKDGFQIKLKDDKGNFKTYKSNIPTIYYDEKAIPELILKSFPHIYLFSIEYENYATV